MGLAGFAAGLVLGLAGLAAVQAKFSCPSWTKLTSDSKVFRDPEQCDKYWTCSEGNAKRSLCPDGLAFNPSKSEAGEDPCDGIHNLPGRCKGREKLQRPKPGDAHCPRQNGVYPSEDPFDCNVFYSCLNGVGSPTRCAEGLHYSDEIGTCVWAIESGREGCDTASKKRKKKTKKEGPKSNLPTTEKPKALSNGFICPGGKLGIHPALPHPDSCRLYYVCLDGAIASDAGCVKGKVFNPVTQQCDQPENVEGCEDFYNPNAKKKKASIAESLDTDGDSADFAKFLQLLKASGVLKNPGVLGSLTNNNFQMGADLKEIKLADRASKLADHGRFQERGNKRPGGVRGPRRGGMPGRRRPGVRRGERPRGRPQFQEQNAKRPFLGRLEKENYDYYADYDDYDNYDDYSQESNGAGGDRIGSQQENIVRQPETKRKPFSSRNTPVVEGKGEKGREEVRTSKPFREVPIQRQNKFTSRFIPRVIPIGNTENLSPIATIRENFDDKNQKESIPEEITIQKTEASTMSSHNQLFDRRPRPLSRIPSQPVAQPKNIADILDRISTTEEITTESVIKNLATSKPVHGNMASLFKRNRQSLFSRTKFQTTSTTTTTTSTTTESPTTLNNLSRIGLSRSKLRPSLLTPSSEVTHTIPQTATPSQTDPSRQFTRRLPSLTATASPRHVAPTPQQTALSTAPIAHQDPPQPSADTIALIASRLFGDIFEGTQASQAEPQLTSQTAPIFEPSTKKPVIQPISSPVETETASNQESPAITKTASIRQPFRPTGSRIRNRPRFLESNSILSESQSIRSQSRSRVGSVTQTSQPETTNERNSLAFRSSRRQDSFATQSFRKQEPTVIEPIRRQESAVIESIRRPEPTLIQSFRRQEPTVNQPIRRLEPAVVEPIRRQEPTVIKPSKRLEIAVIQPIIRREPALIEPTRQREPALIEPIRQDTTQTQITRSRSRSRSRSRVRLPSSSVSSSQTSRRGKEELEALRMARLRGRILEFVTTRTNISDDDDISEAKEMLRAKIESLKLTNKHRARGRRSPESK